MMAKDKTIMIKTDTQKSENVINFLAKKFERLHLAQICAAVNYVAKKKEINLIRWTLTWSDGVDGVDEWVHTTITHR